jgi:hypothetical protein
VYGAGDYCYHGADLGILMTRGRMQTADRQLLERARRWNDGIKAQFVSVPPSPHANLEAQSDFTAGKWC